MLAIIFDFFGVLEDELKPNRQLLKYIEKDLSPNYKLGILSNSESDWPQKILSKEDLDMFDDIVLSYKVGVAKPKLEIYEIAAKNLKVEASEAVFIDDILEFCEAARVVGMKSILYTNITQMIKELESLLASNSNN